MNTKFIISKSVLGVACLALFSAVAFTSCKEDIDDSALAIAKENTVAQELQARPELSEYCAILKRVRLGDHTGDGTSNASPLLAVLGTRGNYTCFAPTNDAMYAYVQSLGKSSVAELTYAEAELIALNSIIDTGDDGSYETPDFPQNGETFQQSNLADRRLMCTQDENNDNLINGTARLIKWDTKLSNGVLHVVDAAIAPTTDDLAELIAATPNLSIFSKLLQVTHWADSLKLRTEEEIAYEVAHRDYAGSTRLFSRITFPYQDKRAVGFTAFVETDEVFANDWNVPAPVVENGEITNWDAIYAVIKQQVEAVYGAEMSNDPTHGDNAVNRFVAYHLLYGNIAIDNFVAHYNECRYQYGDMRNPQRKKYTVDVWDYYTTMGPHRGLVKITQLPDEEQDHPYFINRVTQYDNGIHGTYDEVSTEPYRAGCGLNIKVNALNEPYDNSALNGYYFPVEHILLYDAEVRTKLSSERIRMDLTTMLPELFSNNLRGKQWAYFPRGYFSNIMNESTSTLIYYVHNRAIPTEGWKDYQLDEFIFSGRYDFVLRLPPVPKSGIYEIRMGVSLNTLRGMAQVYIGEDPNKTMPCGLPIDLRESVSLIPGQPWVADGTLSDEAIYANDRALRNQGYMKAPNYFMLGNGKGTDFCRNADPSVPALRRILTTQYLDSDKTYYLRFKSCLENTNSEFFVDYFEFCSTSIVNSETPEDIW